MANERFSELQEAIEEIVRHLKTSPDPQERKALLRQLKILIEEADRAVVGESSPTEPPGISRRS